jgi:hypothetical protein
MPRFFLTSRGTTHTRARERSKCKRRTKRRPLLLERLEDRNLLSTFLVTNTLDDGGTGSLRWAINSANADADPVSNINFNIPGSGVQTITPNSSLPAITHPVIIDGYTQPGSRRWQRSRPSAVRGKQHRPGTCDRQLGREWHLGH